MPGTPPKADIPPRSEDDDNQEVQAEVLRALVDHELEQPGTTRIIRPARRGRRIVRRPFGSDT